MNANTAPRTDCRNCGGDGFTTTGPTCPACNGRGWTVAPLSKAEARANARDPWICPRCHDTKSSGRDLCRSCEAGLR